MHIPDLKPEPVEPDTQAYDQILKLHKKHSKYLGLLPFEAFESYAGKGMLLGLLDGGGKLLGYTLFRQTKIRGNRMHVVHLCVGFPKKGVGRRLVDALKAIAKERQCTEILLRCRKDFPANS